MLLCPGEMVVINSPESSHHGKCGIIDSIPAGLNATTGSRWVLVPGDSGRTGLALIMGHEMERVNFDV